MMLPEKMDADNPFSEAGPVSTSVSVLFFNFLCLMMMRCFNWFGEGYTWNAQSQNWELQMQMNRERYRNVYLEILAVGMDILDDLLAKHLNEVLSLDLETQQTQCELATCAST
jgi:hypothetical protein